MICLFAFLTSFLIIHLHSSRGDFRILAEGFHVQWYNLSVVPLLVKRALKRCVVLYVSQDYILTSVIQIKNTNTVYIHKQKLTTFILYVSEL